MPVVIPILGYRKKRNFIQMNGLQTEKTQPLVETESVLCQEDKGRLLCIDKVSALVPDESIFMQMWNPNLYSLIDCFK